MSAHDRRSTGTQTDDETMEWKANNHVPAQYKDLAHANFTAFNRRLLITGEVPSEEAKSAIESEVRKIEGVKDVYNELGIGPATPLSSRSNDSFITSKVKARLVDSNQISANHIKVLTERGIVYLMGIVNEREAKVAIAVARTTAGVVKVVNVLEVVGEDETRRLDNQVLGARKAPPPSAPVENR
jgi:osmotically-inducible protein OsmY